MFKEKIIYLTFVFIVLLSTTLPSKLKSFDNFESFELKNGLTVYVMEDKNIPVVVHSVFYKVGGIDEPSNKTGIAHLLEHLMFKGTKKYSGEEFLKTIKTSGGSFNAFTSYDYTGYYEIIPKNVLPKIMAMEADRMTNLSITKEMVENEKKIVKEEKLLRIDSNVNSKFFQDYRSVFFKSSPYSRPVIGWTNDFETINLKDVLDFYKTYYSPQNAVVLIAGNINLQEVKALASKYYTSVPAINKEIYRIRPLEEKLINSNDYIHINKELKQPIMVRSYLVDSLNTATEEDSKKQTLNYEILAHMLSTKSGRFYKHLVNETKLAVSVSVSYNPFARGNSMFSIVIVPNHNVKLSAIDKELDILIENIKQEKIGEQEIATQVNKLHNEFIYLKDNPQEYLFFMADLIVNEIDIKQIRMYQNISVHTNKDSLNKAFKDIFSTPYLNGYLLQNKEDL